MSNMNFEFSNIGKEVMQFMDILSRDPNFDINKPTTRALLEDAYREINGTYSLNDIMFVLTKGGLYADYMKDALRYIRT